MASTARLRLETPSQLKAKSKRGHYVSQACAFCRRRKTKCDGVKPICTPCLTSGHDCSWGQGETAKRPSTKAYGESLRNRIAALEYENQRLKDRLQKCHCSETGEDHSPEATDGGHHPFDFFSSPQSQTHSHEDDFDESFSTVGTASDQDEIEQLVAPTEQLVLEERDLQQYGPTSVFRLATKYLEKDHHLNPRRGLLVEPSHDRYVLMIEGANYNFIKPEFDFARYLPKDVPLTRREHDHALDLLFKFVTSWCLRIIPELFLRDMYRVLSKPEESSYSPGGSPLVKTPHYSPMLHNALVALALACSENPELRRMDIRDRYANRAKGYIESECERPNISVVQALSIIGSYHSSRGDQTLGYLYFGMSWRMSQALGLNVDCSPWVRTGTITREDMLDRNWTYWTTFTNDTNWSLYVGREACITNKDHLPLPERYAELDEAIWTHPGTVVKPQPSYLTEVFVETCKLLTIARRIMEVVNGLSGHDHVHYDSNLGIISTIDVDLNTWKDSLPDHLEITPVSRENALPHKLMLHLAYWWLFIILHRPYYRRLRHADGDIDHAKLCNRAASHITSLLSTYRSHFTLRFVPVTLVQIAFSAGTVYLLAAVQSTAGARRAPQALAHALEQAELCIDFLEEVSTAWGCAVDVADILKGLKETLLGSRVGSGMLQGHIHEKQQQEQHPQLAALNDTNEEEQKLSSQWNLGFMVSNDRSTTSMPFGDIDGAYANMSADTTPAPDPSSMISFDNPSFIDPLLQSGGGNLSGSGSGSSPIPIRGGNNGPRQQQQQQILQVPHDWSGWEDDVAFQDFFASSLSTTPGMRSLSNNMRTSVGTGSGVGGTNGNNNNNSNNNNNNNSGLGAANYSNFSFPAVLGLAGEALQTQPVVPMQFSYTQNGAGGGLDSANGNSISMGSSGFLTPAPQQQQQDLTNLALEDWGFLMDGRYAGQQRRM